MPKWTERRRRGLGYVLTLTEDHEGQRYSIRQIVPFGLLKEERAKFVDLTRRFMVAEMRRALAPHDMPYEWPR